MSKRLSPVTREQRELCIHALRQLVNAIARHQAAYGDLGMGEFQEMCEAKWLADKWEEELKNAVSD